MLNKIIRYFLENRVVTMLLLILVVVWGISTSPFNWHGGIIPRNPIPVDAIRMADNQANQLPNGGHHPRTWTDRPHFFTAGDSGVKSIRSSSMFGMSFIYIIFDNDTNFTGHSRILEKLNHYEILLRCTTCRPDALLYWYTLEGRNGNRQTYRRMECRRTAHNPGFLCQIQSFGSRDEVASAGGFVKEYQIELNPDAMRAFSLHIGHGYYECR